MYVYIQHTYLSTDEGTSMQLYIVHNTRPIITCKIKVNNFHSVKTPKEKFLRTILFSSGVAHRTQGAENKGCPLPGEARLQKAGTGSQHGPRTQVWLGNPSGRPGHGNHAGQGGRIRAEVEAVGGAGNKQGWIRSGPAVPSRGTGPWWPPPPRYGCRQRRDGGEARGLLAGERQAQRIFPFIFPAGKTGELPGNSHFFQPDSRGSIFCKVKNFW